MTLKKISLSLATFSFLSTFANAGNISNENLQNKILELNQKIEKLKKTEVQAKAFKLKFSGKHYLGFTQIERVNNSTSQFETRRNYFQTKAYFKENPKSYMRFTYDTHQIQITDDNKKEEGTWLIRLKYAYLYLDNILKNTGVEFGQVHRPWIDYEEHHNWLYRSVQKVFVEASESAHLTNSADLGINFKTKTEYFSSEIGIFNGEGYHVKEDGRGKSFEWRLTAHPLGSGKTHVKAKKDTYLDISFFGQINQSLAKSYGVGKGETAESEHSLNWFAGMLVYNQPKFLIGSQYVLADNEDFQYQGTGFSLNGEFRFGGNLEYSAIARYDSWETDEDKVANIDKNGDKNSYLIGLVYNYNKNVKFIGNILDVKYDHAELENATKYMLSAEVNW